MARGKQVETAERAKGRAGALARAQQQAAERELMRSALEATGGAALVLDVGLQVCAATPAAEALLGEAVPPGVLVAKLLHGDAVERPVAEALAAGRVISTSMARARRGGGVQQLCVRATPLQHRGRALGWVLLLEEDKVAGAVADAPVLFQGMWSRDRGMKRLFPLVEKVAGSEANALVRGETGAGKELVARALHALSPRASAPFRVIGCATLPPHLLEGELFGQASGAVGDIAGGFRLTEGGTLFLDEVAALPLELQARLLRVLETGTVIPSGAREPVPVNVRLVAGTQRNLRREVDAGRFRADLMYRLDVVPVAVPPLRARPGDVMLLAEKFVEAVNARGGRRIERIAPGVRAMLERHDWPGNVRELRNVIEYAFVVGEGPVLLESDLPPELHEPSPAARALGRRVHARALGTEALTKSPEGVRIRRAIERADGNRERAAQILGISRVTLWRRMKALGLAAAQEMED